MSLQIRPGRVEGRLRAPPSKSYTHRAFLLGALSGNALVRHPLRAEDTEATLEGLRRLGLLVVHEAAGTRVGGVLRPAKKPIDAQASGTTLRLLTPLASTIDAPTTLTGVARLAERPMDPLLAAMRELGAKADRAATGLPITVHGPLQGGRCRLPGDVSSQFLSGLLLAAPLARAPVEVELTSALTSRPYVDVTIAMLAGHGVRVTEDRGRYRIDAPQRVRQKPIDVPGDYSSAAFLLAAAAVTGGRVTVEGLRPDDPQGDRAIVDHLEAFGARVERGADSVTVTGGPLAGTSIDVGATPDLFPVLAAVAGCADGDTTLHGAPHLRAKESDRIFAMRENLHAFEVAAEERPDGLVVHGRAHPKGATIQSFGDHRIAMAGAVLALGAHGPSILPDPEVVRKSYPGFAHDLAAIAPGVSA